MDQLLKDCLFIGAGIGVTLWLLIGAVLLGGSLGVFLSILRCSGFATWAIRGFISLIRGTPVLLQLSLIHFALPPLLNIKLDLMTSGILTFGINSSAYMAEIIRAGIDSLPRGQFEAAHTLQIPSFYMWKDIILPQVLRNILPALVNEVITLVKETALISTLGGLDIMKRYQMVAAEQFTYFVPLCIAGAYYFILIFVIEWVGRWLEKRGRECCVSKM